MAEKIGGIMYASILKRVGFVLILVGLVDISYMIYCIVNDFSYSSSFNIFALIAGLFLILGNLRAASIVYHASLFMFFGLITGFGVLLILVPFGLLLTHVRLEPWSSLLNAFLGAGIIGILAWTARELGRTPVQIAIADRYPASWRTSGHAAATAGVALGLVILGIGLWAEKSNGAERALSLAAQSVGPGYNLFVTQPNEKTGQAENTAIVTAWNSTQIKQVPVSWRN